jgi:crossover junction endodeoxyribonuclease RuvC
MNILGIDPGSIITGFGVIRQEGRKQVYLASGCIKVGNKPLAVRLTQIYAELTQIIEQYAPTQVAIEQVFVRKNVATALTLGHARGVALLAVANFGLAIAEYAPRKVKQAVVGHGAAEKAQVQQMVKVLLSLTTAPTADAADALAIAICHGNYLRGALPQ